jgi:hypothetical protein
VNQLFGYPIIDIRTPYEVINDAIIAQNFDRPLDDCKHIALATINHADCLVSLNFKHIANLDRMLGYNGVNMQLGYQTINILAPNMVTYDET